MLLLLLRACFNSKVVMKCLPNRVFIEFHHVHNLLAKFYEEILSVYDQWRWADF